MPSLAHLNYCVACHPPPEVPSVGELVLGKQALLIYRCRQQLDPAQYSNLSITELGNFSGLCRICLACIKIPLGLMLAEVFHPDLDCVARSYSA